MKTADEILDLIHMKIHALRMIPKYSPSLFEKDLNKIISEEYQTICTECKDHLEKMKYQPNEEKKGFLRMLME